MFLYGLTLQRASGINCAIYGNFSEPKAQEVVVARGKVLELLRPDENGRMQTVYSSEVFGCIRSLSPFRLPGEKTDYVIIGSDSGRIVILQYKLDKAAFVKIHQETYGKSGCRRIVPGEYVTVDPKGRACLIGALEKQKFVYVLNRDTAANLTISSPLEAHKGHTICFGVAGLDQGFDNPVFAAIELDYSDADQDPTGEAAQEAQKHLTLYELDLGLNHVVRKSSEPIDNGANLLVPVPGGGDGPGGVLVCAENFIIYKGEDTPEQLSVVIPRRTSLPGDRGVLITSASVHRQKNLFFFLLQSEYGDLYRVTLQYEGSTVQELVVKYFDTIPPAAAIAVMKRGFLFAASEFGDHALYQFQSIGDDDEGAVEASSSTVMETEEGFQAVFFDPRPLTNLLLIDRLEGLMPIMDMKVANLLNEEIPQIFTACGVGPRSTLRVLRPGLAVAELACSPLPGNPTGVFTVRRSNADEFDAYIVVSFTNATLVLSIGETVEEVTDSGFLGTAPTIRTQLLADDSLLQIHPQGLRHIKPDRRVQEWRAPGRRHVTRAASNGYQVVIALSGGGGELLYFELDAMGQLLEAEKKEMGSEVAALDVAPLAEGRNRSRFLAVGSYDSTVRILSLDADEPLKNLSMQQVGAAPDSVMILDSPGAGASDADDGAGAGGAMFLHVGLSNGVLMRTEIDRVTGGLTDSRTRFLGTRPPRLCPVSVRGGRATLALSSRPWLGYSDMGRYTLAPLSFEPLDHAAGFSSDQCPEGIVAVAKSSLRILAIERLGEFFNQQQLRLRYTPRRMEACTATKHLYIAECDHAAIPLSQRTDLEDLPSAMDAEGGSGGEDKPPTANGDDASASAAAANGDTDRQQQEEKKLENQGIEFDEARVELEEQWGPPKGAAGQWAACLRVVDPKSMSTTQVLELDDNEAITSMALASFSSRSGDGQMLVVGTASGLRFSPREADGGAIRVYRLADGGARLELLHRTEVPDGIVGALAGFKGRLLAGVGGILRLYDCGKRKLLRKSEYRKLPSFIKSIDVMGSRIYVGDLQEGLVYMKYRKQDNRLYCYAEDVHPRYLTSSLLLDYDTVAGADKFGNFFVTRLPAEQSAQVEDDPTGGRLAGGGAPHKLQAVCSQHCGDVITSMQRAVMQPGGQEVILYGTIMGTIGAYLPFASKEDVDFFTHLEMHLRQEHPPLAGRDHMAYRSAYFPVKSIIDGDLCEQFSQVPADKQRAIAEELDRTPGEVLKKLEDHRNKVM